MARVLQEAALATDEYDLTEWNAHVGHNNLCDARFSRWAIGAAIAKTRSGTKLEPIESSLLWKASGTLFKLRQCHKAGMCLQKSPIPRTLREYTDVSEYRKTQLADADPTGLSKNSQ